MDPDEAMYNLEANALRLFEGRYTREQAITALDDLSQQAKDIADWFRNGGFMPEDWWVE